MIGYCSCLFSVAVIKYLDQKQFQPIVARQGKAETRQVRHPQSRAERKNYMHSSFLTSAQLNFFTFMESFISTLLSHHQVSVPCSSWEQTRRSITTYHTEKTLGTRSFKWDVPVKSLLGVRELHRLRSGRSMGTRGDGGLQENMVGQRN